MTGMPRSKIVLTKPDFNSRTFDDLNKITTKHWQRQIEQEQKQEDLVYNNMTCIPLINKFGC